MRIPKLLFCALISAFLSMPALALECANAGTPPFAGPDDTDDGDATACGGGASASGENSTALGLSATSSGAWGTALGFGATASGNFSAALGYETDSPGLNSTALGHSANATGDWSLALGMATYASGVASTALGYRAFANQTDTVIIGSIAGVFGATTYANVGIGTYMPAQAVDVERSGAAARFQLTSFTHVDTEAPQYIQRRARGTTAAPTALLNGDNLGLFSFRGHNGTAMGGSRATITAQAAGNFTGASTPTRLIFATTPVGSTTPQQVLVITPDGKVQVNGVNLNVPDYVFEDDYQLMPLEELQEFIDTHGHLPGIAPAHEVKSEGLDLAGAQMGLLQKVEELTLYTLQQQDQIRQQQEHIAKLEALQLEALHERVAQLESQLKQSLAAAD